jgi:transposase
MGVWKKKNNSLPDFLLNGCSEERAFSFFWRTAMTRSRSSSPRAPKGVLIQKPNGSLSIRVQAVGPERFGILSIDVAKARFKMMLADFFAKPLILPTEFHQSQAGFQAAVDSVRAAQHQAGLGEVVVALERTGDYHRPIQRAFRHAGFEVRLVHPFATKQFRQVANPGNKTDDTDLAAIHRAAVNGFGLSEVELPSDYEQLRLFIRHRRDLVVKASSLRCQLREHLHALMPGYEGCFDDIWDCPTAWIVARALGSAAAVRAAGLAGLQRLVQQAGHRCQPKTLQRILLWAKSAPAAHPQPESLRRIIDDLSSDWAAKKQQILGIERDIARLLARTPYVRLLILPGINVVSAADAAGELGPITHYADANHITGRAGLVPTRYQSDRVDRSDGTLRRCGNRRLRTALLQIADNLVVCNHYFHAKADQWRVQRKDPRWMRVKVAKSFSRLAFALVAGDAFFAHPSLQPRHYLLHKLQAFHDGHATPLPAVLEDLQAALTQLPKPEYGNEAKPLQDELDRCGRRRGPQPLSEILLAVLARLGIGRVQSTSEGQDLS